MSTNDDTRKLTEDQMDEVSGGVIFGDTWAWVANTAREKKKEGWSRQQFIDYLQQWREETKMEGYAKDNLYRDLQSLMDYAWEEWEHFN